MHSIVLALIVLVVTWQSDVVSFRIGTNRLSPCHHRNGMALQVGPGGIDVSGMPFVPIPPELAQLQNVLSGPDNTLSDISNALILAGGLGFLVYEKRPRGSARDDLMDVRQSKIPGANLGVFAKKIIPEGTTLGRFPGFLVQAEEALASKVSDKARESAKKYMFAVNDEQVIDPTNSAGTLDLELTFLFGLLKVDTMLARINEPPIGDDVNVYTKIDATGVVVIAERNIFTDEEILMDYGRVYDRSDYEKQEQLAKEADIKATLKKQLEEEDMVRLQPITVEQARAKGQGGQKFNQDTSNPEGFIGKLTKQDETKFQKAGIMTPEEAAGMFTDMGVGMFGSEADRDLIDSMTGKSRTDTKTGGTSTDANSKERNTDYFGRGMGDDDALMQSLKDQMGSNNLEGGAGDFFGSTGGGASASSMFDELIGKSKTAQKSTPIPAPTPASAAKTTSSTPSSSSSSSSSSSPSGSDEMAKRPALTVEEADELTRSLDDMTDAEVQRVLSQLKEAVTSKLKDEVVQSIKTRKDEVVQSSAAKTPKKMPRAKPLNPEVRAKYGKELDAIEDGLEKIYSDPISVWQELMANPDKYLGDETDEGGKPAEK